MKEKKERKKKNPHSVLLKERGKKRDNTMWPTWYQRRQLPEKVVWFSGLGNVWKRPRLLDLFPVLMMSCCVTQGKSLDLSFLIWKHKTPGVVLDYLTNIKLQELNEEWNFILGFITTVAMTDGNCMNEVSPCASLTDGKKVWMTWMVN